MENQINALIQNVKQAETLNLVGQNSWQTILGPFEVDYIMTIALSLTANVSNSCDVRLRVSLDNVFVGGAHVRRDAQLQPIVVVAHSSITVFVRKHQILYIN